MIRYQYREFKEGFLVRFGFSTYSFVRDVRSGRLTVLDVIRWVSRHGGTHVEIVPFGFTVRLHA